jgi:small subunit ribosomal protein S2
MEETAIEKDIKEMLENAVHFGHRKTRQNPKMKPYVFGIRNNVSIIDLEQSRAKLAGALEYIKNLVEEKKTILFVDTRPFTRSETRAVAEELGMPYVIERWFGGTITNWKTISERIEHLKDLESKAKSEEWEKYTKKERHDMEEEIGKLNILWGGIKNMTGLPDAIFVVDMRENSLAIKEARRKNIPVIAIADTNADPTLADYPIPANDDALSSVKYILGKVRSAILKGNKK